MKPDAIALLLPTLGDDVERRYALEIIEPRIQAVARLARGLRAPTCDPWAASQSVSEFETRSRASIARASDGMGDLVMAEAEVACALLTAMAALALRAGGHAISDDAGTCAEAVDRRYWPGREEALPDLLRLAGLVEALWPTPESEEAPEAA